MKFFLQLLLGLGLLIALYLALSAAVGYLIGIVMIAAVGLVIAGIFRLWLGNQKEKRAPQLAVKADRRADKTAEKTTRS